MTNRSPRDIAILGFPFTGKSALAASLTMLVSMPVVALTNVREVIEQGLSDQAARARDSFPDKSSWRENHCRTA